MDNCEHIIKLIDHKIHYKRKDSLLNHFKTYFQFDQVNFSGKCDNERFYIWRYSAKTGIFYSVICGHVYSKNNKTNIILKTKLNSAGILLAMIIFLSFFFGISLFRLDDINMNNILFRLVFAFLPIIVIALIYFQHRKEAITNVKKIIGNHFD